MNSFDCLVVGAGIHGLCTAFWLRQHGIRRVVVMDQFERSHSRGSSHGASRITRSSYAEAEFVAMATRAHRDEWPALERAVGRTLRTATAGVFFGPGDGPIRAYIAATMAATDAVECLDPDRASRRFPLLRFAASDGILLDHTAAIVQASDTMESLRQWLTQADVELRWQTQALRYQEQDNAIRVTTDHGDLSARQVVLACGAWSSRLGTARPTTVLRQQIGYFDLAAPADALRAGAFPVWARIGPGTNEFHYGLPATDARGVKAAVHATAGESCDPDVEPPAIDTAALLAMARQRFAVTVHGLAAAEHCLYTMAPDERLQVVRESSRCVRIEACSGHGFKFGPVIGRIAADLVAAAAG